MKKIGNYYGVNISDKFKGMNVSRQEETLKPSEENRNINSVTNRPSDRVKGSKTNIKKGFLRKLIDLIFRNPVAKFISSILMFPITGAKACHHFFRSSKSVEVATENPGAGKKEEPMAPEIKISNRPSEKGNKYQEIQSPLINHGNRQPEENSTGPSVSDIPNPPKIPVDEPQNKGNPTGNNQPPKTEKKPITKEELKQKVDEEIYPALVKHAGLEVGNKLNLNKLLVLIEKAIERNQNTAEPLIDNLFQKNGANLVDMGLRSFLNNAAIWTDDAEKNRAALLTNMEKAFSKCNNTVKSYVRQKAETHLTSNKDEIDKKIADGMNHLITAKYDEIMKGQFRLFEILNAFAGKTNPPVARDKMMELFLNDKNNAINIIDLCLLELDRNAEFKNESDVQKKKDLFRKELFSVLFLKPNKKDFYFPNITEKEKKNLGLLIQSFFNKNSETIENLLKEKQEEKHEITSEEIDRRYNEITGENEEIPEFQKYANEGKSMQDILNEIGQEKPEMRQKLLDKFLDKSAEELIERTLLLGTMETNENQLAATEIVNVELEKMILEPDEKNGKAAFNCDDSEKKLIREKIQNFCKKNEDMINKKYENDETLNDDFDDVENAVDEMKKYWTNNGDNQNDK